MLRNQFDIVHFTTQSYASAVYATKLPASLSVCLSVCLSVYHRGAAVPSKWLNYYHPNNAER